MTKGEKLKRKRIARKLERAKILQPVLITADDKKYMGLIRKTDFRKLS